VEGRTGEVGNGGERRAFPSGADRSGGLLRGAAMVGAMGRLVGGAPRPYTADGTQPRGCQTRKEEKTSGMR